MCNSKAKLCTSVERYRNLLITVTQKLVRAASPNPPLNTVHVVEVISSFLENIPGVEVTCYETSPGLINTIALLKSKKPGRRLIFNGHLDTYPLREDLAWSESPTSGLLKEGRIYGRGVSDMKGGIAASMVAFLVLAENTEIWNGEIALVLAGDEESMGNLGANWLINNIEFARGDAVICGDVGSPLVIRFGEKGMLWFEITATGLSAHGAHVHNGINAIDRLRLALDELKHLEEMEVVTPSEIARAIETSSALSESLSGEGESETLRRVTVNIGTIAGGVSPNLIPSDARAQGDIRIPVGLSTKQISEEIERLLKPIGGVRWRFTRMFEPTFTSPSHEIITKALKASSEVIGRRATANMRVGASDTRLFRLSGIPSVVVGLTPNNMGAADEYVEVEELENVCKIHTLIAYNFLSEQAVA
ncbi:uncharacterized protein PRCAT00004222001 [Priceomyces carsonii]|uniref:uncharacterized protein n=1 Tax=Priceomyces carsonii TaxID=28549 RepID=UPI002ED8839C|nr:unnamed protein product [Priceomyces carsonii]